MNDNDIIIRPILTEKSTYSKEQGNKYYFLVHTKANKIMLKRAFANLFKVDVVKCNIINSIGKKKRNRYGITKKPNTKKAIVTLKEGQTFEFYEGI